MVSYSHEYGEHFALFTRSASGPNRLSQRISGLVPGKCYTLTYCTADYDDVCEPGKHPTDGRLTATLDAAEVIPELSYEVVTPPPASAAKKRKEGVPPHCETVTHRIVFRAVKPSGELVFSDWQDSSTPGGEPGRRRLLNFVAVKPYYIENEEELDTLKRLGRRLISSSSGNLIIAPNLVKSQL